LALPFAYATMKVLLDCAEGDQIAFKAGYYPMIQGIKIYAGDATGSAALRASETGDANYRLIEGITGKSQTVRDLAAGGTYFYHVKAHYIDGTESDWSDTRIVTLVDGGHPYEVGDVNHDGNVNITDVTALINELLSGQGNACPMCADVNVDGNVNITDVTALINLLLSGH